VIENRTREWLLAHRDYPHEDWCLIWPFFRETRVGRGKCRFNEKGGWAHRFMCELVHGPAPEDRPQAVHSCGKGHEGCVNPRHLSWGTNSQNQYQRYADGSGPSNTKGSKGQFTPEQIETIRSQWGEFTQTKLAEMYGVSLGTIQYYLKYRDQRGHGSRLINHWRPDEDDRLKAGIERGEGFEEIGKALGRTWKSVKGRLNRLKMREAVTNG